MFFEVVEAFEVIAITFFMISFVIFLANKILYPFSETIKENNKFSIIRYIQCEIITFNKIIIVIDCNFQIFLTIFIVSKE